MTTERPPTFFVHWSDTDPIRVTVDYWPDRLLIFRYLVDEAEVDPDRRQPGWVGIRRTGDEVWIVVDNGEATYRIDGQEHQRDLYECAAVRRQWVGASP
jgi:hypothetical protein